MKEIIAPVEVELIEKELTGERFLRDTNNSGNKIFVVTHHNSPNVMREIGRLREITFRSAGGGTGKECDLDDYDTDPEFPYQQLIVWNPKEKIIVGGYRYFVCRTVPNDIQGNLKLATARLFKFSESFIKNYLPYMIELGRSFVVPDFQSTKSNPESQKRGIFTLDNLWDGLGALITQNPDVRFFFGKVTMYSHYVAKARDMILFFLNKHFADKEGLLSPIDPLMINTDERELAQIFNRDNYLEDYKILFQRVREMGANIPPLINAYMNLSPTMKTFGTAFNRAFGNVEETGIMVTIDDIYKAKKDRHLLVPQKA